jgi:hypothetical protein
MMSANTRFARHLRLKATEIAIPRQQLNGHHTAIKRQKDRIEDLRQQPCPQLLPRMQKAEMRLQITFSRTSPEASFYTQIEGDVSSTHLPGGRRSLRHRPRLTGQSERFF